MGEERLDRGDGTLEARGQQLAGLREQMNGIKEPLARLEPLMMRIFECQAQIQGRIADMPSARDFGRLVGEIAQLGQRIIDLNSRLPVPIAYSPPADALRPA